MVHGDDIKLGVDKSKWVDFGVIFEDEGGLAESKKTKEDVEMGSEEILSLVSVEGMWIG